MAVSRLGRQKGDSLRRALRSAIKQNINAGFCAAGFVFMILFFVRRNITRALDYLPPAAFRFCVKPAAPSRDAGPSKGAFVFFTGFVRQGRKTKSSDRAKRNEGSEERFFKKGFVCWQKRMKAA